MTTVYLIRHAEAEGNVYRRCHGQYDSLLTPRAYEQLPCLAKRFEGVPLDAVVAMILPILTPFNLEKAGINAVLTLIVYKSISNLITPKKKQVKGR